LLIIGALANTPKINSHKGRKNISFCNGVRINTIYFLERRIYLCSMR